jgi:hypothetical protein
MVFFAEFENYHSQKTSESRNVDEIPELEDFFE